MSLDSVYVWPAYVTCIIAMLHVVAILCTIVRLAYRHYTRRVWWEDYWAGGAGVASVFCLVGLLIANVDTPPTSRRRMVSEWLASLTFTLVLWAARVSILFSLVRLSNPTGQTRRLALACVASFLLMCLALTGQKIYFCARYKCQMFRPVAVAQLVTDVISDTILIFGPIVSLRNVRLSKNRRILILSAFSSSILISAVSITHSILMLLYSTNGVTLIFAELKAALSLIICNILVMVTFAYRVLRRCGKRNDIDLDASFGQTSPVHFTTVDLNQLTVGTLSGGGGGDTTTCTAPSRTFSARGTDVTMTSSQRTSDQGYPSMMTEESLEMKRTSIRDGETESEFDKDGELVERRLGGDVLVC